MFSKAQQSAKLCENCIEVIKCFKQRMEDVEKVSKA